MKIETRTIGDVKILDCSGRITLGEGTMVVRNTVRDLLKNDDKKIILNLAIGGTNGGDPSKTKFPARFEVDYVRIYQKET